MAVDAAERFLVLLRDNPSLLPSAPIGATGPQMDHRRMDEVHDCVRCGARATLAVVADTTAGPRWLDLCAPCGAEVRAL